MNQAARSLTTDRISSIGTSRPFARAASLSIPRFGSRPLMIWLTYDCEILSPERCSISYCVRFLSVITRLTYSDNLSFLFVLAILTTLVIKTITIVIDSPSAVKHYHNFFYNHRNAEAW